MGKKCTLSKTIKKKLQKLQHFCKIVRLTIENENKNNKKHYKK